MATAAAGLSTQRDVADSVLANVSRSRDIEIKDDKEICTMQHSSLLLTVLMTAVLSPVARAQSTPFDGQWNVVLTCPPHNEGEAAKGYTHRFFAQVQHGELRGTYGTEGEPGWHFLHGTIAPDGSANLRLDGIVNNPPHAINNSPRGKAYTYRVRARFEPSSGTGERLSGRVCEFRFAR